MYFIMSLIVKLLNTYLPKADIGWPLDTILKFIGLVLSSLPEYLVRFLFRLLFCALFTRAAKIQ